MTNSYQKTFLLITALAVVTLFYGCGRSKPSQFPDVVPVSLTVLRDGKPVPKASVKLNYEKSINSAVVTGTTNEQGVCQFQTALAEYIAKGAPVGNVTVTMTVEVASKGAAAPTSPDEVAIFQAEQRSRQEEALKILPPCVLSMRDSTLVYDIPAEGGSFTVNLEEYDDVPVFVPPEGGGAGPPNQR